MQLLVGGDPWVIDLARALRSAGLDVLMWAASQDQRKQIQQAALELAPGELLASAAGEGAELEGITTVLLLTGEDDFNALACTVLDGNPDTSVYRLGPRHPTHGVVPLHPHSDRPRHRPAPQLRRPHHHHTCRRQFHARNRHLVPDHPRRRRGRACAGRVTPRRLATGTAVRP